MRPQPPYQQGFDTHRNYVGSEDKYDLLAGTYFRGQASYTGDAWVYPGCVEYRPEDLAAMAVAAGLAFKPYLHFHPNGQSWFVLYDDQPFDAASPARRAGTLRGQF